MNQIQEVKAGQCFFLCNILMKLYQNIVQDQVEQKFVKQKEDLEEEEKNLKYLEGKKDLKYLEGKKDLVDLINYQNLTIT